MKSLTRWGRWAAAVLVIGCGSKLQVDGSPPGGGGFGGSGGADVALGMSCIPSSTSTEATGTFAQTDITQPTHCNYGLTCGLDGRCVEAPDCPQASGLCVVRRAGPGPAPDGYGGSGSPGSVGGGGSIVATPEPTVVALTADASHLYWVEYGTRDSLGNYQNDGTLMSFAFADGAIKQIATALPGPVGLGVTSKQAYVYVDGAPLIGSAIHSQLLRLPLAGGATELVQNQTDPSSFLGVGDLAFWTTATGTYSESSDAGATPSVFFEGSRYSVSGFVADGANLDFMFYDSSLADTVIESEPLVGGAAQSLGLAGLSFGLKDQALFGIEEIDNHTGLILNQAAKGGGAWQRIRALGAGGNPTLQIAGDRLYWSSNPPQGGYQQVDENRVSIQTASFGSDTPPVRLLELPVPFHYTPLRVPDWATQAFWVGTPSALYWTDGSAIYSFSATNLP